MAIHFKHVRNWLVLLVLLVIFPSMILVIFYAFWEQRREARLQAQETALRVVRLAATEQERLITGAHHLLITLAELPEVRERKSAECSKLLAGIIKKFPYYTNVAAVTPQGDIFCSGLPDRSNPNIADRPYFQEAINERALAISHLLVGRMSGKPNITIAYPSFDPNGPVHAVVFVGLDLTWLSSIAAGAQLPPKAVLLAVDEKGTVFARYPEPEKWLGKSAVTPLIKTIIAQKEGVTEEEGLDGVRRLYGFTTLHRLSKTGALFVSVGIPEDVAFANSNRIFYDSLVVFLIASLLAAAGTWLGAHLLIRRRLENLVAAARALGEVEPPETLTTSSKKPDERVGQFDEVVEQMRLSVNKATGRQADFAAMIAHDLRNPLQTIGCAASQLREPGQTKEDDQRLIDIIQGSCDDLANILNDFLDFSKYRAGYLNLTKEEIDVADLLRHAQIKYLPRAQETKIRLETALEHGLGFIAADRQKLEQLLDNLLSNALKFTAAEGEIEIGARKEGDGVQIWVRDTGVGIAPAEAKTLFSKYVQTGSARKSEKEGTGLGLLICKMIAEGHGGRIRVESELGQGTTFHVWIPGDAAKYLATGTA
jgi:signal transduction histidine kinase